MFTVNVGRATYPVSRSPRAWASTFTSACLRLPPEVVPDPFGDVVHRGKRRDRDRVAAKLEPHVRAGQGEARHDVADVRAPPRATSSGTFVSPGCCRTGPTPRSSFPRGRPTAAPRPSSRPPPRSRARHRHRAASTRSAPAPFRRSKPALPRGNRSSVSRPDPPPSSALTSRAARTPAPRSSGPIPAPSSVTRISRRPPSSNSTSTRFAPASSAFSISSFTADAGRSRTSPAAIRFTTFDVRTWIAGIRAWYRPATASDRTRVLPSTSPIEPLDPRP